MVDSDISFDKVVEAIKQISDLTLLNQKNFDHLQMMFVSHKTQTNTMIAIPHKAGYYWLKVIQYIRTKSKNWKSILSDDFISKELKEFIFEIKTDEKKYSQIGKTIKDWITYLKKIPLTNFRFVLPVNNVKYRTNIEFGKVRLKKITVDILREFVPFHDDDKFFTANKAFEDLTKLNETKFFAIIDVQAKDELQGENLAKTYLKRLIHAMRLFDPPSGITERENYFPQTRFPYLIVNLDDNSVIDSYSNLHLNAYITRPKDYWPRIEPDWQQLGSFLYSDALNELQSLILTSLYWYGEAGKETEDDLSKFLKYLHGLETLLIFDNQYGKGKKVAERLAIINSKDNSDNFDFYNNLMSKYYKFRSGMIHAGKLMIDSEDVGTVHNWLRNLLFEYIRFSKNYVDIETLFKNEFSININEATNKK